MTWSGGHLSAVEGASRRDAEGTVSKQISWSERCSLNSFRLDPDSRGELVPLLIAVVITGAAFGVLYSLDMLSVGMRVGVLLMAAFLVSQFCTGAVRRSLALQYPNARWIGLLSMAYVLMGFGVVGQFVFEWLTPQRLFYLFLLPGGAAVLVFLILNRRDRDVME